MTMNKEKSRLEVEPLENRVLLSNGALEFNNVVGAHIQNNDFVAQHYLHPSSSDLFDIWDQEANFGLGDFSAAYTSVEGYLLDVDTHHPTSDTPYDIKFGFNGTLTESTPVTVKVAMPYDDYKFGDRPLTLHFDNGQRYDVRSVIDNHSGDITRQPLEAATYSPTTPYDSAGLHFRHISDLNNNGTTDDVDLALLTANMGNSVSDHTRATMPTNYLLGDITGVAGIADGVVDQTDYDAVKKQVEFTKADLNGNGVVDLVDLALLQDNYLATGAGLVGDITGPEGVPDETVDMHDYAFLAKFWGKDRSSL